MHALSQDIAVVDRFHGLAPGKEEDLQSRVQAAQVRSLNAAVGRLHAILCVHFDV